MERISREEMFLRIAKIVAERSTCKRARVGAVIVVDNRIVSIGYNGSPPGLPHCIEIDCMIDKNGSCQRTLHAEANAISWAAREGVKIKGGLMYATHSPCLHCAKLIAMSGITGIIYTVKYDSQDGSDGIGYLVNCKIPCSICK